VSAHQRVRSRARRTPRSHEPACPPPSDARDGSRPRPSTPKSVERSAALGTCHHSSLALTGSVGPEPSHLASTSSTGHSLATLRPTTVRAMTDASQSPASTADPPRAGAKSSSISLHSYECHASACDARPRLLARLASDLKLGAGSQLRRVRHGSLAGLPAGAQRQGGPT
jgi:hypothetical protein